MLESFKQKINAPRPTSTSTRLSSSLRTSSHIPSLDTSTTPPGSPPPNLLASLGSKAPAAAPQAQSGQSILDALANIARQNTTAPASTPGLPAPAASFNLASALSGLSQPAQPPLPQAQPPQTASYSAGPQPAVNPPPSLPFSMPQMNNPAMPPAANNYANAAPGGVPAAGGALDQSTQQQILLIKALADQGIPFDKIPALLQSMTGGAGANAGAAASQASNLAQQSPYVSGQPWGGAAQKQEQSRDWYGNDGVRSPRYGGGRSRSRSPDRGWGRNGRDRQDYGQNSPARGRDEDHHSRRGGDYRDRSPPRRHGQSPPAGEKWTDFDPNLPSGSIKVLSRTLFVGGVT